MNLTDVDVTGSFTIELEHALRHRQVLHVHLARLSEVRLRERVVVLSFSIRVRRRFHGLATVGHLRVLPDPRLRRLLVVLSSHLSSRHRLLIEILITIFRIFEHFCCQWRLTSISTADWVSWQALLGWTMLLIVLIRLEAVLSLRCGRGQKITWTHMTIVHNFPSGCQAIVLLLLQSDFAVHLTFIWHSFTLIFCI